MSVFYFTLSPYKEQNRMTVQLETIPDMTCNVFSGMLNPTQWINQSCRKTGSMRKIPNADGFAAALGVLRGKDLYT